MAWKIELTSRAEKQLCKLDKSIANRLLNFLEERAANDDAPRRLGKALKGPLGERWYYRVGDYRIICDLDDGVMRILILQIGNRKEVYR